MMDFNDTFSADMARLAKSPASRRHWTLVQRYLAEMEERKDMETKQAEEERQAIEEMAEVRERAAMRERQATEQQQDPEDSETPPQHSPHKETSNTDIEDFDLSISRIYARLDETQWRLSNCIRRWERRYTCW